MVALPARFRASAAKWLAHAEELMPARLLTYAHIFHDCRHYEECGASTLILYFRALAKQRYATARIYSSLLLVRAPGMCRYAERQMPYMRILATPL